MVWVAVVVIGAECSGEPTSEKTPSTQVSIQLSQVGAKGRCRVGVLLVEQARYLPQWQTSLSQRQGPVEPDDVAGPVSAVTGLGTRGSDQPEPLPVP